MQTPDEKKQMFLDMQEHPEMYSDEQLEAMMDELDQTPDAQTAWQEFQQSHRPAVARPSRRWTKVAASLIGVCMASGIALAAIHIVRQLSVGGELKSPAAEKQITKAKHSALPADTLAADTLVAEPRIFENVPLDSMLIEIATYYRVSVEFQRDDARQLRFHFVWKQSDSLDRVVERLNNFEAVNIVRERKKLIVR